MRLVPVIVAALALGCGRASDERARDEDLTGQATAAGLTIAVDDGAAVITTVTSGRIALWASAPSVALTLTVDPTAVGRWQLVIDNALPDAVLGAPSLVASPPAPRPRPTTLVQELELVAGDHRLTLAAPDATTPGPFRFAALADIQTGLPTVDEVFREVATTAPRFVVFMGDLTERGELAEYELLARKLDALPVPFYATLGNHELWAEPSRFRERYGRSTFRFVYRGVTFVFADSGDAGLDPLVERKVEAWLAEPDRGTASSSPTSRRSIRSGSATDRSAAGATPTACSRPSPTAGSTSPCTATSTPSWPSRPPASRPSSPAAAAPSPSAGTASVATSW